MREYIAPVVKAPLLLTGLWILIGKSDDGKKIERPRKRAFYPNQLREGAMSAGGAGGTPIRIRVPHPDDRTPCASR